MRIRLALLGTTLLALAACGDEEEKPCRPACEHLVEDCGGDLTLDECMQDCREGDATDQQLECVANTESCEAAAFRECLGITTVLATPEQCAAMCEHFYGCGHNFVTPDGQPLSQADCLAACNDGMDAGPIVCLIEATCETALSCVE